MSETKYRDFLRLASAITRVVGILGFISVIVFWAVTKQFEAAILAGCITLTGVGQGLDVVKEIADTKVELRKIEASALTSPPAEVPPPVAGTGGA